MKQASYQRLITGGAILGVLALAAIILTPVSSPTPAVHAAPANPGPDLIAYSVTIDPANPATGSYFNIKVVVRNTGDTATGGFFIYLYVDPPHRPPWLTDPDTTYYRHPGLSAKGQAGDTYQWTVSRKIDSTGCDHIIYAWVDRDDEVIEPGTDPNNNVKASMPFCVGTTPTPSPTPTSTPTSTPTPCVGDASEPDGSCSTARDMAPDGSHKVHNLCPTGDEDWVVFNARAGVKYTIETTAVGPDADTALTLYGTCIGPELASDDPADAGVARIVYTPSTSGEYHVRVRHHSADYGQASNYDLSIMPSTDCPGDVYEKDDSCGAARSIVTNGTKETRLFCAAQDHDWVKFNATSGSTIIIRAENFGADADPVLAIYDSCSVPLSGTSSQQLEWIAPSDETYYVVVQNHDPEVYGPTTNYDLSVTTLGCDGDTYEFGTGDDSAVQARAVIPNADAQTHNFCPVGDQDWIKFDATQGLKYVIETYNLGLDADTYMCLYGPDGTTELACDDDGTGTKAARVVWTSPQAGTYYVKVRHLSSTVSGPGTNYDLRLTVGFRIDAFEPDSGSRFASPITVGGSKQTHNFTPAGDIDWIKFNAAPGTYTIRTSDLAPGCDTVLRLYGADGQTLLATNDDFSYGFGLRDHLPHTCCRHLLRRNPELPRKPLWDEHELWPPGRRWNASARAHADAFPHACRTAAAATVFGKDADPPEPRAAAEHILGRA